MCAANEYMLASDSTCRSTTSSLTRWCRAALSDAEPVRAHNCAVCDVPSHSGDGVALAAAAASSTVAGVTGVPDGHATHTHTHALLAPGGSSSPLWRITARGGGGASRRHPPRTTFGCRISDDVSRIVIDIARRALPTWRSRVAPSKRRRAPQRTVMTCVPMLNAWEVVRRTTGSHQISLHFDTSAHNLLRSWRAGLPHSLRC